MKEVEITTNNAQEAIEAIRGMDKVTELSLTFDMDELVKESVDELTKEDSPTETVGLIESIARALYKMDNDDFDKDSLKVINGAVSLLLKAGEKSNGALTVSWGSGDERYKDMPVALVFAVGLNKDEQTPDTMEKMKKFVDGFNTLLEEYLGEDNDNESNQKEG